jgi:hypothetical protein
VQTQLHKPVLAEVLAQFVVNRVIDRKMVGGKQFGEADSRSLGRRQVLSVGRLFQRTDGVLVETVVDGALLAHRYAASTFNEPSASATAGRRPTMAAMPSLIRSPCPRTSVGPAAKAGDGAIRVHSSSPLPSTFCVLEHRCPAGSRATPPLPDGTTKRTPAVHAAS